MKKQEKLEIERVMDYDLVDYRREPIIPKVLKEQEAVDSYQRQLDEYIEAEGYDRVSLSSLRKVAEMRAKGELEFE
jgi:hypothetical protein